jgi:hypothetical protein
MMIRIPVALLLVVAFIVGLAASRWLEREARAQPSASSTVYVPAEGLAFRSFDGRIVARLSYDSHGGMFEIYDGHQMPSAMLRTGVELRERGARPERTSVAQSPSTPAPDSLFPPTTVDLGI